MTNFKVKFSQVDNSFKVKFASLSVIGASEEFNLQVKPSVVPTKEKQRIEPDDGFYGLEYQEVEPIPDEYIKPEGSMDITENGTFDVTEKAEVNVRVVAKPEKPYIDSSKLKYGAYMFANTYGTDLSLLEHLETSEMLIMNNMFEGRTDIEELNISTNSATNIAALVKSCSNLKRISKINASQCSSLFTTFERTALTSIAVSGTQKVSNFNYAFSVCKNLVTIEEPLYIKDNATYVDTFVQCNALENVRFEYIGLRRNGLSFGACSKLTVDSLLSILNALSDNTELAETYTVTLGSANIAKLTDEQLAIAYNKNIMLQ